jgi:hypothetical protein
MIIPPYQGSSTQTDYFIYTACDSKYFDEFGPVLINSTKSNAKLGVHLHLFNPRQDQIAYCLTHKDVSVTHETVTDDQFTVAAQRWSTVPGNEVEKSYLDRTLNAMTKGRDTDILERMKKTYYACARFIRLAEIFDGSVPAMSMDVDAVVRSLPNHLPSDHDFYVHQITGKKARILAGGMYLRPTQHTKKFLQEYAMALKKYFEDDYVYWGLDQDLLDKIVPRYNHGQLPLGYIDWNMSPTSCIWTAKGTRKEAPAFLNEKQRYTV